MLYYDKLIDLEKLWHSLKTNQISIETATEDFFELRKSSKEAEELDNKINVRTYKKLAARRRMSGLDAAGGGRIPQRRRSSSSSRPAHRAGRACGILPHPKRRFADYTALVRTWRNG
jgi:hypothetical protein